MREAIVAAAVKSRDVVAGNALRWKYNFPVICCGFDEAEYVDAPLSDG